VHVCSEEWGIKFGNGSTGRAADSPYMALYNATWHAIKAVSPRLSVGGPATARLKDVAAFVAACEAWGVDLSAGSPDFVSTHSCEWPPPCMRESQRTAGFWREGVSLTRILGV
jgi:hypothetical protein